MTRYILSRIIQGALVVLGVTTAVFVATRLLSDPVNLMLPLTATAEQRADFTAAIGLDDPLPVQFVRFLYETLTLNFGESLWQRRPALEVVFERLPYTVALVAAALGLAVVVALPLGAVAALRPGRLVDRVATSLSLICLAMPQFWLGLLLILIFAVQLQWLPTSGAGSFAHLILPAVTVAMTPLARLTLMMRSSMIDELNQPYVRTARSKGLGMARILRVHTLRNTLVPCVNLIGWEMIVALSGYTVVVETVFGWPGLGLVAVQAIQRGDLFLMQAIVFTVAFLIVIIALAIDIVSQMIDPRIQLSS